MEFCSTWGERVISLLGCLCSSLFECAWCYIFVALILSCFRCSGLVEFTTAPLCCKLRLLVSLQDRFPPHLKTHLAIELFFYIFTSCKQTGPDGNEHETWDRWKLWLDFSAHFRRSAAKPEKPHLLFAVSVRWQIHWQKTKSSTYSIRKHPNQAEPMEGT